MRFATVILMKIRISPLQAPAFEHLKNNIVIAGLVPANQKPLVQRLVVWTIMLDKLRNIRRLKMMLWFTGTSPVMTCRWEDLFLHTLFRQSDG